MDGNEAVATVVYQTNEFIAVYPITPSSNMGEWADQWAAENRPNIWGAVPRVVEMQSEAGAAGAIHGALQAGALATTFTASQGLLLMIPNMYKIAGELTPTVIHVAARSLATQALSIFCDHSDVMATRSTGFAQLASASVQEAMDFALIAQAASLESRIPFVHFFDGFRTSHEVSTIESVTPEDMRSMLDERCIEAHRRRALSPDHPFIRGTAQNPDVYFQGRETVNPYYLACPAVVQEVMDRFARLTGRRYRLFDYTGAPDAERVVVIMGSGAEAVEETVEYLNRRGEKVGVLKVRLFRPFSAEHLVQALPETVRRIAVLDRTKEPGASGEPLYMDVVTALSESQALASPRVVGGRYGLGSKEFTPAMVKAVFDEIAAPAPKNHFTIGIVDDVTLTNLAFNRKFDIESPETIRCVFYGLGSDGTVGANKNSIKIIGEEAGLYAQAYFVYDSRKSGAVTVSHLRFGPHSIHAPYLIRQADFVACHQFSLLDRLDVLQHAAVGGTFLLNVPYAHEDAWMKLPRTIQRQIIAKKLKVYVIDAYRLARETGMGNRINTIMQTCFFAISGVMSRDRAIESIKAAVRKTYGRRGEEVVRRNIEAVDQTLTRLHQLDIPASATSNFDIRPVVDPDAPEFVRAVTSRMIAGEGDSLPVSALPVDGTYPSGTAKWEKRALSQEIPAWDEQLCIQCGKCVLICPHAVIRAQLINPDMLRKAPPTLKTADARWREFSDHRYCLQVSPDDCTGCTLCVEICPVHSKTDLSHKALNMVALEPIRSTENQNWNFFVELDEIDHQKVNTGQIKDIQLLEPLFEFSGACSGCGETPYLKLLTQLFGDRLLIANATGCSSIFGGNLPTTPWSINRNGRGPAWSNSLFEDNAEFGLGIRAAIDLQRQEALRLLRDFRVQEIAELAKDILEADQTTDAGIDAQRRRVEELKRKLKKLGTPEAHRLLLSADALVEKTVWIVGGDGWAYDIGFGGLDHVLLSGARVRMLVLDTEVYSNTGGQCSKATPLGAVARFAANGKDRPKKDLAMMAMTYGNVYVARVAMGAQDMQTVRAIREAEAYPGPALIIAYAHCIAHGYDLAHGLDQQKSAVDTGYWPLFRYNPLRRNQGKNPLELDSHPKFSALADYIYKEDRFESLHRRDPQTAAKLLEQASSEIRERWRMYEYLAARPIE
ncbi:MAG: pyruvate:ferredoxin (flavodoxin) oxidoreductase [Acidobacteria bacterium]|nr:pyruvate:ferredoxin (flavodoxin) oxidoreductase [Acidobacteriota bacterium]